VRQAVKSDKLKLIVESGGAAAVLLGLVFVGLELRQNTEAVEAATFQSLTDASSNYLLTIASDAELTRINALGTVDAAALNGVDSDRLFILRRSYWVRMQNVFSQWNRGTLSDDDWQLYENVICSSGDGMNSNNGFKSNFSRHSVILSDEFLNYINSCWNE
jgi:hypothetical protein